MVKVIAGLVVAAVIGGFLYSSNSGGSIGSDPAASSIDLSRVLNVTVDTIVRVDEETRDMPRDALAEDPVFIRLAQELETTYNAQNPPLDVEQIGVAPLADASLLAYGDKNKDGKRDPEDDALFQIEIDGANSRVIATSGDGAVNEYRMSGSGIFAGMLLGSMLNRQRAQGASAAVAQKQPAAARSTSTARARAGSGSHSRGK